MLATHGARPVYMAAGRAFFLQPFSGARVTMDDFDSDFTDVMQPPKKPKDPEAKQGPLGLPASFSRLAAMCSDVGLTIRRCAEFHYQIVDRVEGLPVIDFWPSTQKYRFNKAPSGQRARAGSAKAIMADLDEYLRSTKQARMKQVLKPVTRESVAGFETVQDPTPRTHVTEELIMRMADKIGEQFDRAFGALWKNLDSLRAPAPPTLQAEAQEGWETGDDVDPVAAADYAFEHDDANSKPKPSLHSMSSIPYSDEWPATYWVALHALIMRADKLDPRAISQQAAEFAEEAMTYKGFNGYE